MVVCFSRGICSKNLFTRCCELTVHEAKQGKYIFAYNGSLCAYKKINI